jgi:hypothetical protein
MMTFMKTSLPTNTCNVFQKPYGVEGLVLSEVQFGGGGFFNK